MANYCWQPATSLFVLHTLGYVVFAAVLVVQHVVLVGGNLTTNEAINWRRWAAACLPRLQPTQ